MEHAHRVKEFANYLVFFDWARTLKNSHRLNEDFSKETLAYWKKLWEKVKALRKEVKVAYLNHKKYPYQGRK